jgi:hypothetical protein
MERNLFSSRKGECAPVLSSLSCEYFCDLQIRSEVDGMIVLEDSVLGSPVAVVLRSPNHYFKIYSTRPSYPNQKPVRLLRERFYAYASVKQVDKVLNVETESDYQPKYTIHPSRAFSFDSQHFYTKHTIRQDGVPIASTRDGDAQSYALAISPAVDTFLVILLAAIADELDCGNESTRTREKTTVRVL